MEVKKRNQYSFGHQLIILLVIKIFLCLVWLPRSAQAYKNYTVGDSFGWYDKTEKPDVNYQKWADGKNFSLGDFLIFNTNTNHSVVQTYNATTYKLCDYGDAADSDTVEWSAADPSNTATQPVTVAVPLLKEGKTFFFSADYDGDQCFSGQRFAIAVAHGQGLPKSLRDPSDDAPGPAGRPEAGDEDSVPDTTVPSNFDHPKEDQTSGDNDDDDKRSDSSGTVEIIEIGQLSRVLFVIVLGFVCMF